MHVNPDVRPSGCNAEERDSGWDAVLLLSQQSMHVWMDVHRQHIYQG